MTRGDAWRWLARRLLDAAYELFAAAGEADADDARRAREVRR